jgi:group I intron endonuclease
MDKICGIYKITSPTGKIYIGQSVDIEKRFKKYKSLNCTGQPKLYNSFIKHGFNSHIFEIIKECEKDELNYCERHYQEFYYVLDYEFGLNLTLTTTVFKRGIIGEEVLIKRKVKQKGRKLSEEHKKSISESQKGKKQSKEIIEKRIKSNTGKKRTQETKDKIKNALKGNKNNLGNKRSEETKMKMSASLMGRVVSKESREKISKNSKSNKMVIDMETGFFYNSATECYYLNKDYIKTHISSFCKKLKGTNKNNTKFQYI